MDAQQSPNPGRPVVTEIRFTRLGTAIFSVLALMFAVAALVVADNAGGTESQAGAIKSSAVLAASEIPSDAATVSLTEFAFSPKHVMVEKGAALKIVNNGAAQHTLAIDGTDLVTPTLDSKGAAGFSLASLAPGSYQVSCTIPGHKAAGMTGDLMVLAEGADVPAGMASGGMTASCGCRRGRRGSGAGGRPCIYGRASRIRRPRRPRRISGRSRGR
jgi:nitrite reductase (NO-forming)